MDSTDVAELVFVPGPVLTATRTKPIAAKSTVMSFIKTTVAKVSALFDFGFGEQAPCFA